MRAIACLAALVATTALACGTLLAVDDTAPPTPTGDGGSSGDGGGPTLDGDSPPTDGAPIVPACAIFADRAKIDFGESFGGAAQTAVIKLQNFSGAPVSVTTPLVPATGGFSVMEPSPLEVPITGTAITVRYEQPTAGTFKSDLEIKYGASCKIVVPLTGTTLSSTGSGGFAVSPGSLNLGAVPCGLGPADGMINIQAVGATQALSWSASLPTGSPFMVSPSSGNPIGSAVFITVHADPLMPFTDPREATANVTITVGDPDGGTKVVPVSTTSLGAEISFVPSMVTLSTAVPSKVVQLHNSGNEPVVLGLAFPPGTFGVSPAQVTVLGGTFANITVSSVGNQRPPAQNLIITLVSGKICLAGALTVERLGTL